MAQERFSDVSNKGSSPLATSWCFETSSGTSAFYSTKTWTAWGSSEERRKPIAKGINTTPPSPPSPQLPWRYFHGGTSRAVLAWGTKSINVACERARRNSRKNEHCHHRSSQALCHDSSCLDAIFKQRHSGSEDLCVPTRKRSSSSFLTTTYVALKFSFMPRRREKKNAPDVVLESAALSFPISYYSIASLRGSSTEEARANVMHTKRDSGVRKEHGNSIFRRQSDSREHGKTVWVLHRRRGRDVSGRLGPGGAVLLLQLV